MPKTKGEALSDWVVVKHRTIKLDRTYTLGDHITQAGLEMLSRGNTKSFEGMQGLGWIALDGTPAALNAKRWAEGKD